MEGPAQWILPDSPSGDVGDRDDTPGVTTVGDLGNSPGWLTAYRDAVAQGRATGAYILNGGNRFNAPLRPEFVNNLDAESIGNSGNAVITDAASIANSRSCH